MRTFDQGDVDAIVQRIAENLDNPEIVLPGSLTFHDPERNLIIQVSIRETVPVGREQAERDLLGLNES